MMGILDRTHLLRAMVAARAKEKDHALGRGRSLRRGLPRRKLD